MANFLVGLAGTLAFVAVAGVFAFFEFRKARAADGAKVPDSLAAYLPTWARRHPVALVLGSLGWLFWGGFVGAVILGIALAIHVKKADRPRILSERNLAKEVEQHTAEWLAQLGPDHASRAAAIDRAFDEKTATIAAVHFVEGSIFQAGQEDKRYWFFHVSRNLAGMPARERELLRVAELLNSAAGGKHKDYRAWRAILLLGDGKGVIGRQQWFGFEKGDTDIASRAMQWFNLGVEKAMSAMLQHIQELRGAPGADATLRAVAQATMGRLTHGGAGWLNAGSVEATLFAPRGEHRLRLGSFEDGTPLTYSGTGALITIAAPGSGKSQCHVIPNLLTWRAPAVVLDVKDELYRATSRWRAENVGPVYRFSPTDPARSHCYNPLEFVSDSPDHLWQESRFLTDMMIVPSGSKDNQFWDSKAKEVVTAAIASICHSSPPNQRSMSKLLDIVHGGAAFEKMLANLRAAIDVPAMVRAATSLSEMNEKTRADVLATVQTSFHGWGDAPVARVTERSDWNPLDLRRGKDGGHPTIYLCLKPREVESYLSILRVFIAQHIRMLTGEAPGEGDREKVLPVLFMLDELPRLREMPPVAEAIEIGASYGLRVWMFAQSLGQMQNAYANADGMIGSCAVRTFMNPSGADGLAEKLSEELGNTDSLVDGQRRRLAEAADLAGPAYRDFQLVLGLSARPAKLRKDFAWRDDELKPRIGEAQLRSAAEAQVRAGQTQTRSA